MGFKNLLVLFSIFATITANQTDVSKSTHEKTIICSGYSNRMIEQPRNTAKFEDIDLNFCTHIQATDWNSHSFKDILNPTKGDEEEYKRLTGLKEKFPHLKVFFTVGSQILTKYLNSTEKHEAFTRKFVEFVSNNEFDGINLDFGQDYKEEIQPEAFDKIILIVKELGECFRQSKLTLTTTFVYKENITDDYNYAALSEHVDLMSFKRPFYGTKDEISESLHISNLEAKISKIIESVPPKKIILDLYFIGYKFGETPDLPISRGNLLEYNEICRLIQNDDESKWEKTYNTEDGLAHLKNTNESDSVNEIVFENSRSVANRVLLGLKLNLTNFEAVLVHGDDFHGKCGVDDDTFDDLKQIVNVPVDTLKRKFPLLRTINQIIAMGIEKNQTDSDTGTGSSIAMMNVFTILFVLFGRFCSSMLLA